MRYVKLLFVFVFTLIVVASFSLAKPEYSKKESKPCGYCHVKVGSKDLNDVGKCYKENNLSLAKCGDKAKTN
jgi:hypothetical protein